MIVGIDIGNTSVKLGFFEEKEPIFRLDAPSDESFGVEDYWRLVEETLPPGTGIEGVVICSVVPSLTPVLTKLSTEKLGAQPIVLEWRTPMSLVNTCSPPDSVGSDRLANAFAAWKSYEMDAIVVDIGTAITVDVVTREGKFLGGMIVPGIEMAADALHEKTALLPRVVTQSVQSVLGKDTVSAIRSGLTHGYAALISGVVEKVKKELGFSRGIRIILTGGYGEMFQSLLGDMEVTLEPDLTLKGLNLIYWELSENDREGLKRPLGSGSRTGNKRDES
jgi:type III pantothenate kinase